jgi:leucyl-tRNA---protein transferase
MSAIDGRIGRLHQFYRSGPLPCPYLPGRIERKLFTRLIGNDAAALNAILSQAGFRRSHDIIYRPVCPGCRACVPVRIPVLRFTPGRAMRRTIATNADLRVLSSSPRATDEQFRLFARYQRARHGDSDMARMSRVDFGGMIEEGDACAELFEFRDGDDMLRAAILVDVLDDGISAVYSFFDPDTPERGLGTYMILTLIEQALRRSLSYVYLGYWIAGSRKMAYKTRFRPLEALGDAGWTTLAPDPRV